MIPEKSSENSGQSRYDVGRGTAFGKALKKLHEAAGGHRVLTLKRLAGLGDHKVSTSSLSEWLRGERPPGRDHVVYVLGVLIPYLEEQAANRSPGYRRTPLGIWQRMLDEAQNASRSRQGGPGPRVNETSAGRLVRGPSQALRDVLPFELVGREGELAELVAFATAPDDAPAYLQWQAGPWAGKTALLSWFAARCLPPGVDALHYVIAGRLGTDRRDGFVRALREQLVAAADGKRLPPVDTKRPNLYPLYEVAARASAERQRRLLLIVDGLDEDADVGLDGQGIAGLLPKDPPYGMRVIVTGRPHPRVPVNLAPDHPLRDPLSVRRLTDSPAARVIRDLARAELRALLADKDFGQRLLGLLVAARGALSGEDLSELVQELPGEVQVRLSGVVGRSMTPTRSDQLALDVRAEEEAEAGRQTFVLAHRELHDTAEAELGKRFLAARTEELHSWARQYWQAGWPEDTPNYLLTGYTRLVREGRSPDRLQALVLDPKRQLRLVQRSGPEVALADLDLVTEPDTHGMPSLSPAVVVAVSLSREVLLARVRPLPGSVARTIARLGDVRRARALAAASTHSADKAVNLADLARVLRSMGHEQEADVAQEAGLWARKALRETGSLHDHAADEAEAAVGHVAITLLEMGLYEEGLELLRSTHGMSEARIEAWAQAAALLALDRPDSAAELLDALEEQAEELAVQEPANGSAAAAVQLWQAVATAAPDRAARLHDRVLEHAREVWCGAPTLENVTVVAAAASLVAQTMPGEPQQLLDEVCRHVECVLCTGTAQRSPRDAFHLEFGFRHTLAQLEQALTDTGAPPETMESLLECALQVLPAEPDDQANDAGDPDEDTMKAGRLADDAFRAADRGADDEAERHLEEALALLPTGGPGTGRGPVWLPALAAALVRTGAAAEGVLLPDRVQNPAGWVRAHAAMALAYADSRLPTEARAHARKASRAVASAIAPEGSWVYAAQALAGAGETESALELIRRHVPTVGGRRSVWRNTDRSARIAVAAELASLHPQTAGELVLPLLERLHATRNAPTTQGLLPALAELLPACTHLLPEQQRLLDALREEGIAQVTASGRASRTPEAVVVHALLRVGGGEDPGPQLEWLRRDMASRGSEHFPSAALAVLHAALGDIEAAEGVAARSVFPQHRAEVLTAVASTLARVTVRPLPGPDPARTDPFTLSVQDLALKVTSTVPPDDEAAVELLHRALATTGWYQTLPVLARLAPKAVIAVRDIAVVHLPVMGGVSTH
ncbi:hypothetical protein AB0F18_12950 [Streptomyces sp. NPDC029216]|uniref:hypothetical protein n=1 Tax=Streptomyces sp. NPDC029216 TaxID=3154701 RepID=UPI0033F6E6C1